MSTLLEGSFQKIFLGTQVSGAGAGQNPNPNLINGFLTVAGVGTDKLINTSSTAANNYGTGSFGFFDAKTFQSVTDEGAAGCCPLILAAASPYANDKISPNIGGMKETNKSKIINPKYVYSVHRITPCDGQQQVTHIGSTKYTKSLSPLNGACSFGFRCGETYSLRIDLNGSPALRFLNHNIYRVIDAYTGCCPTGSPTSLVDSTNVMILWANAIINDPILSNYLSPIVYSEAGVAYYQPGSTLGPTWDTYVSPGHTAGLTGGLRLLGAYVDTKFGNCSFEPTDFFEKEPVKITVSLVDFNGDPCVFQGICVVDECLGRQGEGYGETAVRDLILSESYRQNDYNYDPRIREVTQGDQIVNAINRNAQYTRYIIKHSIPRPYNPSGIYDNDRYSLEIITTGVNAALEAFLTTWLTGCTQCTPLQVVGCNPCVITAP